MKPLQPNARSSIGAALRRVTGTHATGCACAARLTVDELDLSSSTKDLLARAVQGRQRPTLSLLRTIADALSPDQLTDVTGQLEQLAGAPCLTRSRNVDPPDVPWRERKATGVHAEDDRWPDEWDPVDWADWTTPAGVPSSPAASLSEIARDRLAARLVGRIWEWNGSPPDGEELEPERWSRDEVLRSLFLVRTTQGYPWVVRISEIAAIAAAARQTFEATCRFVRYVDECDRGVAVPDLPTRAAIESFRRSDLKGLGARVRMIDDFAGDLGPLETTDPDGDDALRELNYRDTDRPASPDGQPDPLAEIKNLLPGGKWVLGKAPIVHSPTELETELLPAILIPAGVYQLITVVS